MTIRRRLTPKRAALRTLPALTCALGVLGAGAYAVYANVGQGGAFLSIPAPEITAKPPGLTTDTWAHFRFTEPVPGLKFECSLDGSPPSACASPKIYRGPLAAGRHTFRVSAGEAWSDPELSPRASYTWSVIRRLPKPDIVRGPSDPTGATSATFSFTDRMPRVRFQCRLDGGSWRSCARRITYWELGVGERDFLVRAVRPPTLASYPASFGWRVMASIGASFSISSGPIGPLYPGAAPLTIPITLTNPNGVPIHVSSISVSITSGPPGCDGATNLSLVQSNASSVAEVVVPAGGSVALPAQGVAPPTLALRNRPVNQDACKNGAFSLHFSGSAGT
jgi:large repetitive protein